MLSLIGTRAVIGGDAARNKTDGVRDIDASFCTMARPHSLAVKARGSGTPMIETGGINRQARRKVRAQQEANENETGEPDL